MSLGKSGILHENGRRMFEEGNPGCKTVNGSLNREVVTVDLSGDLAQGAVVASGAAIGVTAVAAGWILSAAGRAVCFVPNEVGRRLTHHERVTR